MSLKFYSGQEFIRQNDTHGKTTYQNGSFVIQDLKKWDQNKLEPDGFGYVYNNRYDNSEYYKYDKEIILDGRVRYVGFWKDYQLHGYGVMSNIKTTQNTDNKLRQQFDFSDCREIKGFWLNNRLIQGLIIYEDGSTYLGEGLQDGEAQIGTRFYIDVLYTGEFKNMKFNGYAEQVQSESYQQTKKGQAQTEQKTRLTYKEYFMNDLMIQKLEFQKDGGIYLGEYQIVGKEQIGTALLSNMLYTGQFMNTNFHGCGQFLVRSSDSQQLSQRTQTQQDNSLIHKAYYNNQVMIQKLQFFGTARIYLGEVETDIRNTYIGTDCNINRLYTGQYIDRKYHGYAASISNISEINKKINYISYCNNGVLIYTCMRTSEYIYVGQLKQDESYQGTKLYNKLFTQLTGQFEQELLNGYGVKIIDYTSEIQIRFATEHFQNEIVKYIGLWDQGKLLFGNAIYNDLFSYEGQLNALGHLQGHGQIKDIETGMVCYDGQFKDSKFDGTGQRNYDDGSHYIGNWSSDQPQGQGTYIWFTEYSNHKHRRLFNGSMKAPIPMRNIVEIDDTYENQNNSKIEIKLKYQYKGNWNNGKFEGQGELLAGGLQYKGEFKNHQMHGAGFLITRTKIYTGQWKYGKLQGADIDLDNAEVSLILPEIEMD